MAATQAVAVLAGDDKAQLAAVAQAMAANLPKLSAAGKAAQTPAKGSVPSGAAKAARKAKAPSKAVVEKVAQPAMWDPAKGEGPTAKPARKNTPATAKKIMDAKAAGKPAKAAKLLEAAQAAAPAKAAAPKLQAPGVYMQGTHSAIVVSAGSKLVNYIAMDSAALELRKEGIDKFAADYKLSDGYPVEKAAAQYLALPIMKTPQAESMLLQLAGKAAHKPLAKGEPVLLMSKHDEKDADTVVPQKAVAAKAAAKPAGRVWEHSGKTLALGDKKPGDTIRDGTLRLALMDAIVAAAKKKGSTDSVLGLEVMAGKPKLAKVDVEFAVRSGFVKYA